MLPLEIGIAGAGIGGLSAAVALSRLGHVVKVYESAKELREIGAGIQIAPNANRHLLRWGLGSYLPDLNRDMSAFKIHRWNDDLQQALRKVAERHGAHIFTDSGVQSYDFEAPAIILKDGTRLEKDLIIAADGVHSNARKKLNGSEEVPPVDTGLSVYRATLSAEDVACDPSLGHTVTDPGVNLWLGPDMHVVVYSMRDNSLVNLVLEHHESRPQSTWDESTYVQEMKAMVRNWDPSLVQLFEKVESAQKWPLKYTLPSAKWSSNSGKLLLLGDASQVVPSFLAQGAAMAIEDAAVLSSLLQSIETKSQLKDILKQFESVRMPRKKRVQDLSLHNIHLYHLEDGPAQRDRDSDSASGTNGGGPIWRSLRDQEWLYGYNYESSIQQTRSCSASTVHSRL